MKTKTLRISQEWVITLAILMCFLAGCGRQDPAKQGVEKRDAVRFLAEGEKETAGFYQLNNVLLATGQLVWLDPEDAKAMGIGDTLKQAQEKGRPLPGPRRNPATKRMHAPSASRSHLHPFQPAHRQLFAIRFIPGHVVSEGLPRFRHFSLSAFHGRRSERGFGLVEILQRRSAGHY